MITYSQTIGSDAFRRAWLLALYDKPIYARVDGVLREIDGVVDSQIELRSGEGLHDVIVFEVVNSESKEAME